MINPSAYYFSPSAIAINLNVSAGFIASETVQVSVAAGAAVKVANQLTTQTGKVLNIGYTAALEYRTFRVTGVNTVFGYTPPSTYYFRDARMRVYLRLDASNNGVTGEVVFLPYEVDYDGKLLLQDGELPISYPDISVVNGADGYALANENADNESGLQHYYIHIATIGKPEGDARTWEVSIQTGQLETAKGNNEKGDSSWEQLFKLVNNLIQPQKAFEKLWFSSGVVNGIVSVYIDRIYDTVADSLEGFASWSHSHAVATTQSVASYVKATVESIKGMFIRKDRDDETKYKLKMGEAEVVTNLSVGGDAEIEGDVTVGGKMKAKSAEVEEDLSVGGDVEIEGSVAVGDTVKANKIVPRTGDTVEIGGGSDKTKVKGNLEVTGGSEFQGMTQHRDGLQVGTYTGNGILGTGAEIDKKGNTVVESLTARSFFSAPEYRFNRITVTDGESWSTNGLGTIESVTQITRTTGYITLHLNEGEYGSVMEGDICRGIYNKMAAGVVEGGVLFEEDGTFDDCGFMKRYGFFTSYFWVKTIVTNEEGKCTFLYELRNASTPHPCVFMRFAQYGSFTNEERQSSSYENTHPAWYRVVYLGVNDWQIQPENISQLQGWLKGFTIRLKNGQLFTFQDRGLYIDKNIYFGESITELDPATIEDLRDQLALYDVELDIVADTITIDPTGNVLGGLWTEEKAGGQIYKKYRLHTAITVKKGDKYLLLADDNKDADEGEYKIYVASSDCDYFVDNGTVYITRIKNIKDQIAGSDDDVNFDYDAMREMKEVKVTVIVDCEGKGSINRTFCVTVNHVDTAFISAHLDNQVANVSWNTRASKYIGLPYTLNINAWHNAEELSLKSLVIGGIDDSHYTKEEDGKGGYTGKVTINSLPEELAEVTNVNVTFTVEYAGVIYERTLVHSINRTQDTNVYELIPSPSSINAWREEGAVKFSSEKISCDVRCTSNDGEVYILTGQQMKQRGLSIAVQRKREEGLGEREAFEIGGALPVDETDELITFYLVFGDTDIDTQGVLIVYDGTDGLPGANGAFKSMVFIRQNVKPNTPVGGTYDDPVPSGWSDGIPDGTAILWASVCTFYGDGNDSGWSEPAQQTDTDTLDIEFSPSETQPDAPSGSTPFENHESEGWYDASSPNAENRTMIWRAERKVSNGVYDGEWVITRIYGEKGDDATELYYVELDIAADTIMIDPTGNVLGGLWTEEQSDGQTYRKYRLHTAVTAMKGERYLLLADDNKEAGDGEYKIHVASSDCDYFVDNGTVYITRIKNIKDQIAGSGDDVEFDYDAMREMKEVKVAINVDCEGVGIIIRTFCITVNHVDTAFISAHLDNQVANVSWNTKAGKYIGLPYTFHINAWHNTEILRIKNLVIDGLDESNYTKEKDVEGGYTGAVTIKSLPEGLAEVTNVNVTFTVEYAGVIYERTLVHSINRTQDTNVYELIPSPSSINAWYNDDAMDFSSGVLSCQVRCSSNESEPYMLTPQQMKQRGLSVTVQRKNNGALGNAEEYIVGNTLTVKKDDEQFTFRLLSDGKSIDEQDVLVVYDGKQGEKGDSGVGQTLRPRGLWKADTEYENSEAFVDVILHSEDGVLYRYYKCEKTHTSGEIFETTNGGDKLWDTFNQFDNVATSVLLANQGFIEVLGAGRLWIGKNKYGEGVEGWLITDGKITHTKTGLTLTADGRLYDPDGLHLDIGLEGVGIDILNKIIIIRSNNFKVQNDYGDDTFYVDKHGDVTLAGYLSEKVAYISNLDDWLSKFFPISEVIDKDGKAIKGYVDVYGDDKPIKVEGFPMMNNNQNLNTTDFELTEIIGKHWGSGFANYGMLDLCKCNGIINIDFQPRTVEGYLAETVIYLPWIQFNTAEACTQVSLPSENAMAVRLAPYSQTNRYKGSQLFTNGDGEVVKYPPYTTALRHGAPTTGVAKAQNILPKGYALYFNIKLSNDINGGIMYSGADLVFVNSTDADITLSNARIYYYYTTNEGDKTPEKGCSASKTTINLSGTNVKLYAYISINGTYKTNAVLIAEYNGYGMQFLRTITTYGNQPKHFITYEEMLGMLGKRFVMHNNTDTEMYILYDTQEIDEITNFCKGYVLLPPNSSMGFTMIQEETYSGTLLINDVYNIERELWLPKLYFKPDHTDRAVIDFVRAAFNSANFGEQVYFEDDDNKIKAL